MILHRNPQRGFLARVAPVFNRRHRRFLTTALGWSLVASSLAQTPPSVPTELTRKTTLHEAGAEIVVLPKSVPDPIEPVNRMVYTLNRGIMTGVVKPTAKVYRFIVFKPIRTGIGNFGRNITFPGRLIKSKTHS